MYNINITYQVVFTKPILDKLSFSPHISDTNILTKYVEGYFQKTKNANPIRVSPYYTDSKGGFYAKFSVAQEFETIDERDRQMFRDRPEQITFGIKRWNFVADSFNYWNIKEGQKINNIFKKVIMCRKNTEH